MLLTAIENLLNRNFAASPKARELCAELRDQRLRIQIDDVDFAVGVEALGHSLRLFTPTDEAFHAEISGSPLNLLALMGEQPERLLQSGAVRLRGDAIILQRFRALLTLLRPDFEEELAQLIGDLPAHQLLRAGRSAVEFGQRSLDTLIRNVSEFLAHERGDLVPRSEAETFLEEVDRLREAADRAVARVDALHSQLETPPADDTVDSR